ncbi:MAG: hypothetical protein LUQ71_04905 [Methanoregula sp.]|nr:hypothetical protein [Methanoregula sp.]
MRQITKMILLAAVLLIICTSPVSAFTVESYVQDPSGPLAPDTPVTVSYTIGFVPASGATFPSGNNLVMTTELTRPNWTYTLILEGIENKREPVPGQTLDLSGFELSYPSSIKGLNETVRVTLTGTAPGTITPTSKKVLDIYEIDNLGNITTATQVTKTAVVSLPAPTIPANIAATVPVTEKITQQNGILDQIIRSFKGLFGIKS